MKTVTKSVLIWYSPEEMYALVTDVARYPQFLPWCDHAQVLQEMGAEVTAEVGIAFGGMHHKFITCNQHVAGRQVSMKLVKGPFSHLDGVWEFSPVGDGSQRASKVALTLRYGFDNVMLGKLIGPVFDKIASSLVDAFVKRAAQIYGE